MATFTLNTSLLTGQGNGELDTTIEDRGLGVQFEWNQPGARQDIRLHGWALRFVPAGTLGVDLWPTTFPARTAGAPYGTGLYGAGYYGGIAGQQQGVFILNYSRLAYFGSNLAMVPVSERGRTVQIEWNQPGSNQDLRLHGWALQYVPAEGESAMGIVT